jgi:hypothetical protein
LDESDKRPSRLLALPLVIAFLFETWVWDKLVAFARFLAGLLPWAAFRDWARIQINRAPAIFAVLLFGIPLAVAEGGSFISVVMMATGHVFAGVALYIGMKIFGLLLIPVIFELTREKLLALPWFAWCYARFEILHEMARRFVAPYKEAAKVWMREQMAAARAWMRAQVAGFWASLKAMLYGSRSAARASAAKSDTASSSARAVAAKPASPSH